MVKLSIKIRDEHGRWKDLPVSDLVGKTLEQFFNESQGKEIVAEFELDGTKCYFAGTDHWIDRMSKKGKTISFEDAVTRLKEIRPDLLLDWLPDLGLVDEFFKCSTIDRIEG